MSLSLPASNAVHGAWNTLWFYPPVKGLDAPTEQASFLYPGACAFERDFVASSSALVMRNYISLGWFAVAAYLVMIIIGQRVMRDRKPFDLKIPLAAWNLLLAIFSIAGSIRVIPVMFYFLYKYGFTYLTCRTPLYTSGAGPVGVWMILFIWSKYAELLDTVFLVLRKKPVNFLHWFHHATVLLYCWYAGAYETPTGVYFAAMNYAVHSVMYSYYFLAAINKTPKWGKFVTVIQILQMFGGIGVTFSHWYLETRVANCNCHKRTLYAAVLMYCAYLALFLDFFVKRYLLGVKVKGE